MYVRVGHFDNRWTSVTDPRYGFGVGTTRGSVKACRTVREAIVFRACKSLLSLPIDETSCEVNYASLKKAFSPEGRARRTSHA